MIPLRQALGDYLRIRRRLGVRAQGAGKRLLGRQRRRNHSWEAGPSGLSSAASWQAPEAGASRRFGEADGPMADLQTAGSLGANGVFSTALMNT